MERVRLAGVNGPGGRGSGYAVGGRLVLTSAHVTGPAGTGVKVFHPAGTGTATGTVLWAGTAGGRDDAALVFVDDSPHWQPPTAPVQWGRPDTTRPGTPCETWGVPDEAQREGHPTEAAHLHGEVNPGSGFVGNQYVMDLRTPGAGWPGEGTSPWGGLSGAAVFCDRYLTGVVAADRANSAHGRLNVVPSYVLHHDPAFRTALTEHGGGPAIGLEAVEFQDIADPTANPTNRRAPVTPAALLEAGRQIVPFHGREDLLAALEAWCQLDGFGAWLLHGPAGQGKTRLAHHLGRRLAGRGWTVLWPRAGARPEQLLELRRAAKPLLVVLDYAETRPDQIGALVDAAAEHPGTSPFKLLLLARTAGDWWQQARDASRQAEDHLTSAHTHRLTALEDNPDRRASHYRDAAHALAAVLPFVEGLAGHDWAAGATSLKPPRRLGLDDAYGNALTLHMAALADLLDTAHTELADRTGGEEARDVEDRLLAHEARYWRDAATAHGLTPGLSRNTLEAALAAAHLTGATDREHADLLWQRLPALADQSRDRRDRITAWLTALYPTTTPGSPWGALQPDRLAERHIGRVLEAEPRLADQLLDGADDSQTGQLLTVYSRAAAHPAFQGRLDTPLTGLCLRHHEALTVHIIATATRTGHPAPLTTALDTLTTDPTTPLNALHTLYDQLPHTSQRLATIATRVATTITRHYRALAEANPDAYLPDLAKSLANLSVRLGAMGRRAESLAAGEEAVGYYRALAEANPDAYLPDLAGTLNGLSVWLGDMGRQAEGLAAVEESVAIRRSLAEADPNTHLPGLATALNNLSNRLGAMGRQAEGLAAIEEAVAICRALAEANPDAHLPDLASTLGTLSNRLGAASQRTKGLAAGEEAVGHFRTLAKANPDAHLPDLASTLNNLSVWLGDMGRQAEGLAAGEEAVGHFRALAEANPDAYLPDLASTLGTLSNRLGAVGRWAEGLAAIEEAVAIRRALAEANPDAHLPDLAITLGTLSNRLGEASQRTKGLTTVRRAVGHFRTMAETNPDTHRPNLIAALNGLSVRLVDKGRQAEGLAAIEEAVDHYRTLAEANPDAYLPDLATTLNNLSVQLGTVRRRAESLASVEEAVAIRRALAEANPDAHLPGLAKSLTNLSLRLGAVGRRAEGLAAAEEAVGYYQTLVKANPDAYRPNLIAALTSLYVRLRALGRRAEGLAAIEEAVDHYRTLVKANPDAHPPNLGMALIDLGDWLDPRGRQAESLITVGKAVGHYRALAEANATFFGPALQWSRTVADWLKRPDP
ncbi:tetratricopeptide repeat protein [Kitasatospora sp. NPDC059462]|uniref:tetratricopeptide repeat protein n=1 Tax=Kitasatospora sp. NPDC059462 TaxID=3346841 RepID=UPI0036B4A509